MKRLFTCLLLVFFGAPAQALGLVVFNEIGADAVHDYDGDGIIKVYGDEFVELRNVGLIPVDIGGWKIYDRSGIALIFPLGTIIQPGEYIVVFGGSTPETLATNFANIQAFSAGGRLGNGLRNQDETVYLADTQGTVVDSVSTSQIDWGNDQSVTRHEITNEWVQHSDAPGVTYYSPGKPRPLLCKIAIEPQGVILVGGDILQLTARGLLSNQDTADITQVVEWSSADTNVVTIDAGLVTAKGGGIAIISAKRIGLSDSALVEIIGSTTLNVYTTATVSLPEGFKLLPDSLVTLPVILTGIAQDFISFQCVLTYDGRVINPSVPFRPIGWEGKSNIIEGGDIDTLKVAMATAQDTIDGLVVSRPLFHIIVEAVGSVGDSTLVHFESFRFNECPPLETTRDCLIYIVAPPRLLGDVTNNGVVTAYDAAWILQHTVGHRTLTGQDSTAADVSSDGTISAYDASLVLQYVIGKIYSFPTHEVAAKVPQSKPNARTVWLDGHSIRIDEMDGVVAGEVVLSFSGDAGEVRVNTSSLTSDYLLAYNIQDGRIRISFAGAESSVGSGAILELKFDKSDVTSLNSLRLEHVSLNEGRLPVRIVSGEVETPEVYQLHQNYPNPFNPETTIRYDVAKTGIGTVCLTIHALNGQRIRTLVDGECPSGTYTVVWDGKDDTGQDVASGVYLYRLEAADFTSTRRMVLVR